MSNDTILREVNEELRGDRMRALWRSFGPYVIGAAVGVVLIVAASEGWSWWQNSNAARASDEFYAALDIADGDDAAAAQAALNGVIDTNVGGYPILARFRQAAILAESGQTAEAIAAYDALAGSINNQRLRELALVFAANLLVDGGDVSAVQTRVGGLISPENPMRNAAREALGLVQYRAGDLAGAAASFEAITNDPQVNPQTRNRVQLFLLQVLSEGDGVEPPLESAAEAEPDPAAEPALVEEAPAAEDAPAEAAPPAVEAEPASEAPAAEAPADDAVPADELIPDTTPAGN
ncbi:tetratricopeptide repeat protein [Arsenicitalea aurantiaca]|uniref:Tetratricopeptide repeat protein n=1 Tax=Arsenicitalea aurantiaca TaxID=1783274 RepID=A0A433X3B0_9HYPH|nr:tetratricopeptide repeat protein [Arsenicitalea aurantiaca]RUT28548.1 tetratricopeptide repeat protein [Arsenicitalea aurantiaca]